MGVRRNVQELDYAVSNRKIVSSPPRSARRSKSRAAFSVTYPGIAAGHCFYLPSVPPWLLSSHCTHVMAMRFETKEPHLKNFECFTL